VLFLYPDSINWIQGEGKDSPVSSDVPGQAGFDAGDNSRYYTLPGSGMPQVTELARLAPSGPIHTQVVRHRTSRTYVFQWEAFTCTATQWMSSDIVPHTLNLSMKMSVNLTHQLCVRQFD